MKSKIAILIPLILVTTIFGILLLNIILGDIGKQEEWRIISASVGFGLFMTITILVLIKLYKK